MKYRYTRKEIVEMWSLNKSDKEWLIPFIKDLLAQKEDKKEWKPCDCPKGGIDGDGMVCDKCGGTEWVKVKTTPSPLEIEEIKEMSLPYSDAEITINKLIRNQKKLYQFIKEKL